MKILGDSALPNRFFASLRTARRRVLFLDYDGTLAPFRVDRDRAFPYPGVRERLGTIGRDRSTRLVLISGRWTEDLIPLLGTRDPPEIWGSHGWERLLPGEPVRIAPLEEAQVRGLAEADDWAAAAGFLGRCERKPAGLAVHFRGLPPGESKRLRARTERSLGSVAHAAGLEVHEFDGGIELRAPGRTKGLAVDTVLGEEPAGIPAAYLGDDRTDEDAFRALAGRGLRVLVRTEERPTEADVWIRPPDELLRFLDRWISPGDEGGDR
ncbi:MAG: trehalose-phosphatase [Candidatus Eisenbacteria bacterium]